MIFRFGSDILVIKNVPTVRMMYNLTALEFEQVLLDGLIEWSSKKPITYLNVSKMKWSIASELIRYYSNKVQEITADAEAINSLVRTVILYNTSPLPDSPIMLKYGDRIRICFPCVDNEANLVVLPSGISVETMRLDDFFIIEAIIAAKVEYIKREQAAFRR